MSTDKITSSPAAEAAADANDILRQFDRESNVRIWTGIPGIIVNCILAAFSLFSLYVALFATMLDEIRLTSFIGCIIVMGFLTYPASKKHVRANTMPWYDFILMLAGSGAFFYYCFNATKLIARLPSINNMQLVIGIIGVLVLFELCRRSTGVPIIVVAAIFMCYALYYYGIEKGQGFNAVRYLISRVFYLKIGIMATPIDVCSKYIAVFIVFGAFLERTGISDFFIRLANAIAGSSAGGPAKVAVISSALCGMVSGSSVGNTVTTGSVTIPLMKKTGYDPEFAGAVEAASSTGGQIMPPIMGAAAFLMIDYIGIPYSGIVVRAIIPAILYFTGIFLCVHLEAKKLGLKGMSRDELPKFGPLLKQSYLLLPLIVLTWIVCTNSRTMAYAAAVAIVCSVFVSLFNKENRITPKKFFDALAAGGRSCITVGVACCIAGIIAGCLTMTGLANQILNAILAVSGQSMFIALFLTMLCCIVLGMGVPTTANYCIMAATCAPILVKMGIPQIAAHFFVFYFGIVADITPPVALAAYAGAAIAKGNPMKTGLNATKLAIAAFIIPYVFAFNPAMLIIDTTIVEVISIVVTAIIGMIGVASALEGYMFAKMHPLIRIAALAGGLCLLVAGTLTDVIGVAILAAVIAFQFTLSKKQAKAA